jgi:hypothetical protein
MGSPTVTPIAENWHVGAFIVTEQRGHLSRAQISVASGAVYLPGTVLGATQSGGTAVAATLGTNVGNGTFGAITVGSAAVNGVYVVELDSATTYIVSAPGGQEIGHGATGVAFSGGGLGFTITAGGTAFTAADSFIVTVSGGTFTYAAYDPTATSGLQNAVAILYGWVDATSAAKNATAIVRLAEVNTSELVWGANVTTTPQKTAALTALAAFNIIGR